jgi:glucosamine--fructose-6-phosphate aminotransferase (isomerizing)
MAHKTLVEKESAEAPAVVARQIRANAGVLAELSARLKRCPPPFAVTIARGSSDHAATFAKYLFETKLGIATSSAAPSVFTLYKAKMRMKGALAIGISQSGASPDICEAMACARKAGAITVSFVNNPGSPLARESEYIVPLWAGEERAVAATKSYIAALAALIHLNGLWSGDRHLIGCLRRLPESLEKAAAADWSAAVKALRNINDTLVIARGYCFPAAQEAALKLKETCSIHAEAFSGAEVLHGPYRLIRKRYPVLIFTEDDTSLKSVVDVAGRMKQSGARILLACPNGAVPPKTVRELSCLALPVPASGHVLCAPLLIIQACYPMIARLALSRGRDPDFPGNLNKITETF